ncbi:MAG: chromate transporter [Mogibacterium sp.]|nr:chromate transporter [Mogibacterium sp.]
MENAGMNVLTELFILFFKLGAFTIGGGVAMLPLLQNTLTQEKKWFSQDEFVDIVAVCQSLPGVIAINMATYVGYKKKGFLGSLVSTFGVVLPSFVMILLIATFISNLSDNPYVAGAMAGLRAAALGLVVVAVIQMSSVVFKGGWTILAAAVSFVLIAVLNINTAYVILLFVVLGVASALIGDRMKEGKAQADNKENSSSGTSDGEGGSK